MAVGMADGMADGMAVGMADGMADGMAVGIVEETSSLYFTIPSHVKIKYKRKMIRG
jgi:hypothetical protein